MNYVQEAAAMCAHASAVVKQLAERVMTLSPESPRTHDDQLDIRATIALAVANLALANKVFDEAVERANEQ